MANELQVEYSLKFNSSDYISDVRLKTADLVDYTPYIGIIFYLTNNCTYNGENYTKGPYVCTGKDGNVFTYLKLLVKSDLNDAPVYDSARIASFVGTLSNPYPTLQVDTDTLNYYTESSATPYAVQQNDMFQAAEAITIPAEHNALAYTSISVAAGEVLMVTAIGSSWKAVKFGVNLSNYVTQSTFEALSDQVNGSDVQKTDLENHYVVVIDESGTLHKVSDFPADTLGSGGGSVDFPDDKDVEDSGYTTNLIHKHKVHVGPDEINSTIPSETQERGIFQRINLINYDDDAPSQEDSNLFIGRAKENQISNITVYDITPSTQDSESNTLNSILYIDYHGSCVNKVTFTVKDTIMQGLTNLGGKTYLISIETTTSNGVSSTVLKLIPVNQYYPEPEQGINSELDDHTIITELDELLIDLEFSVEQTLNNVTNVTKYKSVVTDSGCIISYTRYVAQQ